MYRMTKAGNVAAILAAGILLSLPLPSRAQITSYVDGHGKVIYVNDDSLKGRAGSTISAPSGANRARQASEPPNEGLDRIVRQAAERHQVDPALVKAVITTESSWNPRAISRKGAVGLMQLVPQTAQRYGVGNLFDPAQNVEGGTTYLRSLLDKYNGDLPKSLAAYNAGERAVDDSGGVPWYPETQRYVQKVTQAYFRPGSGRDTSQTWSPPSSPMRREVDSNGRVIFTNE